MKKVYPIPYFMPVLFSLAALGYVLIVLIYLLVIVTGSAYEPRDLLLPAILTPVMALVGFVWAGTRGDVILEEDRVIVRSLGREQALRYAEILAVRERDWRLPPRMVLVGRSGSLSISRRAENFDELYRTLRLRIPTLINRELAATGRAEPWCLRWTRGFVITNAVGLSILALFLIGLFVLIVNGEPTVTGVLVGGAVAGFLALLIALAFVEVELQPKQPCEYIFRANEIRYRCPFDEWRWISADDLNRIDLRAEVVQTVTQRRVVLIHSGGQELVINLRRARQFGCEPEQIYEMLKKVYS